MTALYTSPSYVTGKPILAVPHRRSFNCKIGAGDPQLKRDAGAGPFFQRSPDPNLRSVRDAILFFLPLASCAIGDDAAKHLKHYLDRSGADYTIDLERMVREVTLAGVLLQQALDEAESFALTLGPGRHSFTSGNAVSGNNDVGASRNWHFAVGGYSVWGKGQIEVQRTSERTLDYTVFLEYRLFDRYNWDKGKEVNLMGIKISDKQMGDFHRQGLAREFDMIGSLKRTLSGTRILA